MPEGNPELRIRLPLPVFDATHDRDTGDDAKELPHVELLGLGTDGKEIVYPVWGRTQESK